jgi:hypothetical protein
MVSKLAIAFKVGSEYRPAILLKESGVKLTDKQ